MILAALKVFARAVVQLLSAVGTVDDTRKHICLSRSCWSALVLSQLLHLFPSIAVGLVCAINTVVDSNESNVFFRKQDFSIVKLRNKVSQLTGTLFDKICILLREGDVNYARATNTS